MSNNIPQKVQGWDPKPGEKIEGVIIELRSASKDDRYRIAIIQVCERDSDDLPQLTDELMAIHAAWPRLRSASEHWKVGMALSVRYIGHYHGLGKVHEPRMYKVTRPELVPPILRPGPRSRVKRRRTVET